MFIIDFNDLFIKKLNKNNIRLVRICVTNSNGVYDRHNYNFDFSQNM
jgi:hypothetical protein